MADWVWRKTKPNNRESGCNGIWSSLVPLGGSSRATLPWVYPDASVHMALGGEKQAGNGTYLWPFLKTIHQNNPQVLPMIFFTKKFPVAKEAWAEPLTIPFSGFPLSLISSLLWPRGDKEKHEATGNPGFAGCPSGAHGRQKRKMDVPRHFQHTESKGKVLPAKTKCDDREPTAWYEWRVCPHPHPAKGSMTD